MKKVIVILTAALGLTLVIIAYVQKKERTSNLQAYGAKVTLIDLSNEKIIYPHYYFILGISLICVSLIISNSPLDRSRLKNKSNPFESLTSQERRVIQFMKKGKSNKEIANELSISLSTVKAHNNNIYKKMGVNSRIQLIDSLENLGSST